MPRKRKETPQTRSRKFYKDIQSTIIRLFLLCCVLILLGMLIANQASEAVGYTLMLVPSLVMLAAAILVYRYAKCPHCSKRLAYLWQSDLPKYCLYCGKPLYGDDGNDKQEE
ncbi:MAG: hypothetical protein LBQ91_01605 [Oscillospiraceae bacterium]|jgi:hypothetical protein|nr:hypothetical protein [Oscillospiraceae bacterium]